MASFLKWMIIVYTATFIIGGTFLLVTYEGPEKIAVKNGVPFTIDEYEILIQDTTVSITTDKGETQSWIFEEDGHYFKVIFGIEIVNHKGEITLNINANKYFCLFN